ncbi:MAG: hypothetical protein IMX01_03060 [Limnochordaceae bacterium]|nr:hypothetical protein [Limnochordaceae bacterium]
MNRYFRSRRPPSLLAGILLLALASGGPFVGSALAQPAVSPALDIHGLFTLRADQYHGAVPLSPPGSLPPGLADSQRREAASGQFGWGVQQVTRLQLRLEPMPQHELVLTLCHLGWWGVDQYTSGTYGAPAFLSDPFRVEELYASLPVRQGRIFIGRQYFQLGPMGLLAATPLGDEQLPSAVTGLLWEGPLLSAWSGAAVVARLAVEPPDEAHPQARPHDLLGVRLTPPRRNVGINLLLAGPQGEQGLSLDWDQREGLRSHSAEIAVARLPDSNRWVWAAAGRSQPALASDPAPSSPSSGWSWQWAALDPAYPVTLTQLRDQGGDLPFAPGEAGWELRWDQPVRPGIAAMVSWRLRLQLTGKPPINQLEAGWTWAAGAGLTLAGSYQHTWTSPLGYGRARVEVRYGF